MQELWNNIDISLREIQGTYLFREMLYSVLNKNNLINKQINEKFRIYINVNMNQSKYK